MTEEEPEEQKSTDYTGVIIGAIALPVYFLFRYFANPDIGLSAFICVGMIMLAVRLRWALRKCFWFWATIVLVLLLHVPVVLLVPWPHMTVNRITLLPIGFAELLIVLGAVRFVEKVIVKYVPPEGEE